MPQSPQSSDGKTIRRQPVSLVTVYQTIDQSRHIYVFGRPLA